MAEKYLTVTQGRYVGTIDPRGRVAEVARWMRSVGFANHVVQAHILLAKVSYTVQARAKGYVSVRKREWRVPDSLLHNTLYSQRPLMHRRR